MVFGSSGRARTADLVINSHPLYQLSYRGKTKRYVTCESGYGQLMMVEFFILTEV
jgi:hypothetical protein